MSEITVKDQYKETVNLPKTDFPMKANLPEREPKIIENWKKIGLYKKILQKNQGRPSFTLPDGPPYANGNIHIGHALNKILKDMVVKYKNMSGAKAPFVPGWDCHGLPIEQKVLKDLGPKAKEKTEAEIRALCRAEAQKWISVQMEQFERLGVIADWENPYRTMDPDYEAEEIRALGQILRRGIFYRGEKPVYWCIPLRTALAEAEVEYHEHKSPAIYVKFPLKQKLGKTPDASMVIWTTTPWTLPANVGIALHPEFDYEIFETEHGPLVIANALKEAFEADTGIQLKASGQKFKGRDLEGMRAQHPFYDRDSVVICGEHVTAEAGTGAVHTAPGHGQEDYKAGLQYGLPVLSPVDEAGKFTSEVPEYAGTPVFEANPKIIERLKSLNRLLAFKEITHSYPHCWRTKSPLIFRATPQWFISMDEGSPTLRTQALDGIKQVNWVPKWGENRITGMISARPDWCLSRQRTWGVPIPVFYCEKCGKDHYSAEWMEKVADKMDAGGGMEAYHSLSVEELIGPQTCRACGHSVFKKGKDILDVWFDSGVCWAAVQKKREGLTNPADLYLEGSDQHRGWFHTSLLAGLAAEGVPPYRTVLTHGFVMYAKGQKMSKSLGNVIEPKEVMKTSGAEILRLWAAHEDYAQDLTCSPESLQRVTETYRRLRNTMRFLLGNMGDFDPKAHLRPYGELMSVDRWMLAKLNGLIETITEAFEKYEFYRVYHLLNEFVTVELSAVYLDVLKDRLYTWKADGTERRAAQTVLYHLTTKLSGLMAPILTFLAEETYSHLPGEKAESIFLTDFPQRVPEWENSDILQRFEEVIRVRSEAQKHLEQLRQQKVIGASLEAQLEINAEGATLKALESVATDLSALMIVSKVRLARGPFNVSAMKALGKKCARCWHYYDASEENQKFPEICPKCVRALS